MIETQISVRELQFEYRTSGCELFGGISYDFMAGAVYAITGASGRGKSTLLYLMGLMLRPKAGEVLLRGDRVDHLPDARRSWIRATHLGFVFQDSALDPQRSILDSVIEPALYRGMRRLDVRPRAIQLLNDLGVEHRTTHKPGQISGGQAQRVAIARALVNDSPVILADEPTGNLDEFHSKLVLDALCGAVADGRTVVIATHDRDVLARADEILAL